MLRFLLSFVVLLGLDTLWIGYLAKAAYFKAYAQFLRFNHGELQPLWWAASIVYLALVGGLYFFVLSQRQISMFSMLFQGFIFGLVVYAVYDFTCLALFKDWPACMTFVDTLWGGILCSLTCLLVLALEKLILSLAK